MKYNDIYLKQAGLNALGFGPIKVDGEDGPETREATTKFSANYAIKQNTGGGLQITRWNQASIKSSKLVEIDKIVDRIVSNQDRYQKVAATSRVPWYVIAGLHNMESSGNFNKHLHEGSPLTGRTKYVPKGRPLTGKPPFTWEESALDALKYDGMDKVNWASLEDALYACERYNGLGYLKYHQDVPSPYLWSGTSIYQSGKYIADGKWSQTAISAQIGIAAIWKRMIQRNLITL